MPIILTISVPTPGEAAQGAQPQVTGPIDDKEITVDILGIGMRCLAAYWTAKNQPLVVPAKAQPKPPEGGPGLRIVT